MARKYKQGERILSIADFDEKSNHLNFFMVYGRTTHIGWIQSWQYHYLKSLISKGVIYEALPTKEENNARSLTT